MPVLHSETPEWVPYTHYLTRSGETITYPTGKLITSSSQKYSSSITRKNLSGNITEVNALLAHLLGTDTEHVYEELDYILGKLLSKNPLHTYG